LLFIPALAHAGISEIKAEFPNQAAPMSPSTVVTTGSSSDASYLLCIANYDSPVKPTLAWTDENGRPQSWAPPFLPATGYGYYGCHFLRNHAGASVTVATAGSLGRYSLAVFGFGFWPNQPQKQGGITEVTLGNNADLKMPGGPYLIIFSGDNTSCEFVLGVPNLPAGFTLTAPAIFPFYAGAGYVATEQASPSGTCDSSNQLSIIAFGEPSAGPGPLLDSEVDLLDWTNATYPYFKTVFTAGSVASNVLLATNIGEQPNSGSVAEQLAVTWPGAGLPQAPSDFVAEPSGLPASAIVFSSLTASASVEFRTFNSTGLGWGLSPPYSAEVDLIQF
jgi:hypothetical protein